MTAKPTIQLVDFGVSNIAPIFRTLEASGVNPIVVSTESDFLSQAQGMVLPGVGSFDQGITQLMNLGLDKRILDFVNSGRLFIGVCLGFQLLAKRSSEGKQQGLGIIPMDVVEISMLNQTKRRVHNGWFEEVPFSNYKTEQDDESSKKQQFYFTHSYGISALNLSLAYPKATIRIVRGTNIVSSMSCGNIFASQFHPERSHFGGITYFRAIWKEKFLCD